MGAFLLKDGRRLLLKQRAHRHHLKELNPGKSFPNMGKFFPHFGGETSRAIWKIERTDLQWKSPQLFNERRSKAGCKLRRSLDGPAQTSEPSKIGFQANTVRVANTYSF
jgi:hypothetical protein